MFNLSEIWDGYQLKAVSGFELKKHCQEYSTFSIITKITEFKGFIASFKSQEQLWFIESLSILHSMDLPVSKGFTKLCTYIISNFEHTVLSYTTTDSEFYRRRLQGSTVDSTVTFLSHMNRWVA